MSDLNAVIFKENLEQNFQGKSPDGQDIKFVLTEVNVNEKLQSKEQESFALIFQGPTATPFEQGIFNLTHEKMGDLSIFLVPVEFHEEGYFYEAVFNILKTK